MEATNTNPFSHCLSQLEVQGKNYQYYDLNKLNDQRIAELPVAVKVLLECAIRNCD